MSIDDFSLTDLFRVEAQSQVAKLTDGLVALDDAASPAQLEELMRAAHSLKGAARIVGYDNVVRLAHELEECFVATQEGRIALTPARVDVLLQGVDMLSSAASGDPATPASTSATRMLDTTIAALREIAHASPPIAERPAAAIPGSRSTTMVASVPEIAIAPLADDTERLLSLAGEALVTSRVLHAHTSRDALLRARDRGVDAALEQLRATLARVTGADDAHAALGGLRRALADTLAERRERAVALDLVGQRVSDAVSNLYETVLDARMRPFGDGVAGMPRMVRDTARELGRDVRLSITGESTPVDREVMRRLEAPLGHLIRNAVDHGIEPAAVRSARGKPPRGTIRVEARHAGGRLLVSVEDDGQGIDMASVRARVVERGLADAAATAVMGDAELATFLFLPGFTLRETVTSISGRGVGLDAVQTAVREMRGDVRVLSAESGGTRFELLLPLTLSVVRALVVEIGEELYAFPLARVHRVLRVTRESIASVEGRPHFSLDDRPVALVWAHVLLELPPGPLERDAAVVVIGDEESALGVVVDRFVGEEELVLRGLDPRLGKLQDVGGAALLADGSPTLVLDVDDLQRTASNMVAGVRPDAAEREHAGKTASRRRVLVVDDSLTVRELERKMIEGAGYAVDVAVDGMDAWNAVRKGHYDLVVTDVDMPRMDGIELVTRIKGDAALRAIPVMIVSYKDRDEDRRRGLDAGADYYLTKGSFYDETMLRAISDFIGDAS